MAYKVTLTRGTPEVRRIQIYIEDCTRLTNWVGNGVSINDLRQHSGAYPSTYSFVLPKAEQYGTGRTWDNVNAILATGARLLNYYVPCADPAELSSTDKFIDLLGTWKYQRGSFTRFVTFAAYGTQTAATVLDADGVTVIDTYYITGTKGNGMEAYGIPIAIPADMTLAQFVGASKEIGLMPYSYDAGQVATWSAIVANDRGWTRWLYYLLHNPDEDAELDPEDDDPYGGDDSPYDDATPGGGDGDNVDPYDDGDDVPVPALPEVGMSTCGMMSIYTPSDVQLNLLASYLWDNNFVTSMVKEMYVNCMDVIISLGVVPFDITPAGTKNIKVGDRDSGISSNYPSGEYFEIDCGSLNIQSVIGSYMDYEPYTKLKLYLPYIGWVDLNNDLFMKKALGVVYHINIATGECLAFVTSDGNVIGVYTGNCLMKIPLSGANYGEMWGSVIKATIGLASCGMSHAAASGYLAQAGAATTKEDFNKFSGKAQTATNKANSAASGAVNSLVTKPTFQFSNQMGMTSGFMGMQTPVLMVTRPNLCIPAGQNIYQGYPAFITTPLSSLKGFTRLADIQLSIPSATSEERAQIQDALISGVIIEGEATPTGTSGKIYLYRNKSANNVIGKTLESVDTLTGTFRESVDVHAPRFRIERSAPDFNYVYIPDFGRCYYVESITVVRTGVLDVSCAVDPLNSFKGEILANRGIINKQANLYNLYLNDDSLKVYQNPLISLHNFSAGFSGYEYVLLVAGG